MNIYFLVLWSSEEIFKPLSGFTLKDWERKEGDLKLEFLLSVWNLEGSEQKLCLSLGQCVHLCVYTGNLL